MPRKKKTKASKRRPPSRWLAHVKREYKKNPQGGLRAVLKRAKKNYRR